jgi:hypothetical protein
MSRPPLPRKISCSYYYRLDFFSEHGSHLESSTLSFDGDKVFFAVKRPNAKWHIEEIHSDKWKQFEQVVDQCGFWSMPTSAMPGSLGGGVWRLDAKLGSIRHTVYRINPEQSMDEANFLEIVSRLRHITKASP